MITKEDILNHRNDILNLPIFDKERSIDIIAIDNEALNEMLHRFDSTFGDFINESI